MKATSATKNLKKYNLKNDGGVNIICWLGYIHTKKGPPWFYELWKPTSAEN